MLHAFRDGVRRVAAAPAILLGLLALSLLIATPLGLALKAMMTNHLGASLAADTAAAGINWDWMQEFQEQATGVGEAFGPQVIGFAAPMSNLSRLLDNGAAPVVVAAGGAAYVVLWVFLIGGILDRYARQRATRAYGFFGACGGFFFRFLRLGVIAAIVYGLLFGPVHHWLFDDLYGSLTRNLTVERTAFQIRLALYTVFVGLLALITMTFDYAKIRAVVEDRHSAIGALIAAGRFAARRPASTLGLYALNGALFAIVLALYAVVAPGVGGGGASVWWGFIIGQVYLLARLAVKLVFYASQIAYFQSQLAHASYAAAPEPVWPESPSAEALANLTR